MVKNIALALLIALALVSISIQIGFLSKTEIESRTPYVSPTPTPTKTPEQFGDEIADDVNQYRGKNALSLLTKSAKTCAIAAARLVEVHDDWSHNGFHKYSGFASTYQGENLAKEYLTPKDVVDHWIASPTHKENLDRSIWNHMCIATDGNYVVQIFSD